MDTMIGFILGIFVGAAITLFICALVLKASDIDRYAEGFNDGINFNKNKERRQ